MEKRVTLATGGLTGEWYLRVRAWLGPAIICYRVYSFVANRNTVRVSHTVGKCAARRPGFMDRKTDGKKNKAW